MVGYWSGKRIRKYLILNGIMSVNPVVNNLIFRVIPIILMVTGIYIIHTPAYGDRSLSLKQIASVFSGGFGAGLFYTTCRTKFMRWGWFRKSK